MKRFGLLYRRHETPLAEDRRRIEAVARVLDDESERLLLVEGPERELRDLVAKLPDWTLGEEHDVRRSLPQTYGS